MELALARPQPDGSDTRALLALASGRWGGQHAFDWPEVVEGSGERGDGLHYVRKDDPRIRRAYARLIRWPLGIEVVKLADTFMPVELRAEGTQGCSSGHVHPGEADGRIGVFVTVDDPIGCADGLLHECAHQRLHCLGVDLEQHDGLLLQNDFQRRFFSPIRRDVLRPMSALLHGIYAWTFMLENELAQGDALGYLAVNVPKVRAGLATIERHAEWTEEGERWAADFFIWARDCVWRGTDALVTAGIREELVPLPEEGARDGLA